ncbi:hypothetical protein [Thermospira aquatica]|uniref:Uncharacterized protein n=1 Tax=Thermospira aquatica TaxID=2828656 RepID=A0AAX3BF43_9SPIR|nr:hypothetical protein [Thermospira aquatica]URA10890.1 hypothetical protein KDW03_03550 [Thermospira aquatica]
MNEVVTVLRSEVASKSHVVGGELQRHAESETEAFLNEGTSNIQVVQDLHEALERDVRAYDMRVTSSEAGGSHNNLPISKALSSGDTVVNKEEATEWVISHAKSGDILWCAYNDPISSGVLSGHTGTYYSQAGETPQVFTTMGPGEGKEVKFHSLDRHTENNVKSGKLLVVGGKTAEVGRAQVEEMYRGRTVGGVL